MQVRALLFPPALGFVAFLAQALLVGAPEFLGLSLKTNVLASEATARLIHSPAAWGWILYYVLLGTLAHAIPFFLAARIVSDLRRDAPAGIRRIAEQRGSTLLAMLLVMAAMLAWNQFWFPRDYSRAASTASAIILHLTPVILTTTLLAGFVCLWLATPVGRRILATGAAVAGLAVLSGYAFPDEQKPATRGKPDVILLGVDSMRPDHLGIFGDPATPAPGINAFFEGSPTFENAYTPQGRTFVAYMSLLTGQYPTRHGVRENLYPRSGFRTDTTIAHTFRRHDYATMFALDEVRFANIDESFGFDVILAPPPGAIELVVGTLFNSAGTNLLQKIPGSHHLLRHVAGNRALHSNYEPSLQVAKLDEAISAAPADQPLLLVAHFCMAHVPFAHGSWRDEQLTADYLDSPARYRKALSIADRQVMDTMASLRRSGRLENAIVVMFSDHGEGLGMKKDHWSDFEGIGKPVSTPLNFGHGTIALEDSQSRVALAIQKFSAGKPEWKPRRNQSMVSLVDVAPTVVGLAHIDVDVDAFDGFRILDESGAETAPAERPVFIESGILGRSLETINIDQKAVAEEFGDLYRVTDNLLFELEESELPRLLKAKQRAVILGRYGVASMPNGSVAGCWMLADYATRERACFKSPGDNPVVDTYSRMVCEHFSGDKDFHRKWCDKTPATSPFSAGQS